MRAVLQRISKANVSVDEQLVGSCGEGFLILLGVGPTDDEAAADKLWHKIARLRVFDDEQGRMNRSLLDINGEALVISQFTLYADCRKGNRPSFTGAARPEIARPLYEYFCSLVERDLSHVGRGTFGAEMHIEPACEGPITIWLDTDEMSRPRHR